MKELTSITTDKAFEEVMMNYPSHVAPMMEQLRVLVREVAKELLTVINLHETLKWGEPSYVTKYGSTLRMDWKTKSPEQCALYFKCTSLLVATFKDIYGDQLNYEGSRAILLPVAGEIPKTILKACIGAALQYHKVKKLPLLGLV